MLFAAEPCGWAVGEDFAVVACFWILPGLLEGCCWLLPWRWIGASTRRLRCVVVTEVCPSHMSKPLVEKKLDS